MSVEMILRIITQIHAADPEIGFLTKLISKLFGRATAMPTAWKLSDLRIHLDSVRINTLVVSGLNLSFCIKSLKPMYLYLVNVYLNLEF